MSDVDSANAGLDMNQPGPISGEDLADSYWGANLVAAVAKGSVNKTRLDDMVRRVLTPYIYLGQNSSTYPTVDPSSMYLTLENFGMLLDEELLGTGVATPVGRDVRANHSALIREIGAAGSVLLKNTNGFLPLKAPASIGVFGEDAADINTGPLNPNAGYDIGTAIIGGGSGGGRPTSIVPPLEAIKARAKKTGATVQYITNNTALLEGNQPTLYPWPNVCLVFLKTWSAEGYDHTTLEADHDSAAVVDYVASLCPEKTVVITHSGGPNIMPWASNPNISAIIAAHYPCEESGNSIVDVLYGDVNPSGRLPYTIAKNASDYGIPILNITGDDATQSWAWQSNFTEGLYIDYRHFDHEKIDPLYEFGYGLSYTTFDLSPNISMITPDGPISPYPAAHNSTLALGGNPNLWMTLVRCSTTVQNTGNVTGAAVVQLYIALPQLDVPSGTPVRVLRGFEKVLLKAGESRSILFHLMRRDLSYWDVQAQEWKIPSGSIEISVGFSSRNLPYNATVTLI